MSNTHPIKPAHKDLSRAWRVRVSRKQADYHGIDIKGLTIGKPDGPGNLINNFSLSLKPGDRFVLTGESGSGKSTIIRAILIKSLNTSGTGEIDILGNSEIICLSQRANFPGASLAEILSKKLGRSKFSDDEMDRALADVGLDKLRIMIPVNQAKPEYMAKICAPYGKTAIKKWGARLARMNRAQRGELFTMMEDYIERHLEKFIPEHIAPYFSYPDDLKPFMNAEPRRLVAQGLIHNLQKAFEDRYVDSLGGPNLMSFGNRIEKFSRLLSRYFLQACSLELEKSLKDGRQLSRELSGGEQQKIGFAQTFLHKPNIIFLDESTSAMDKNLSQKMYEMVVERFPNAIIFSIAHNPAVISHHTLHGHLSNGTIKVEPVRA